MIPTSFPAKEEIARLTAGMLIEIGAIHFNAKEPFTHASGKKALSERSGKNTKKLLIFTTGLRRSELMLDLLN